MKILLIIYLMYESTLALLAGIYLKKHKLFKADGINVYKVPKAFNNYIMNVRIAGATQFFFWPIIIVDEEFDKICKCDTRVGEFIIAHELGHIKLGHIKENYKYVLRHLKKKPRDINHEMEADTYACTTYPHVNIYDGIKFVNLVKGIEEERIDNIYILYDKLINKNN
jgi:hypothetical protein